MSKEFEIRVLELSPDELEEIDSLEEHDFDDIKENDKRVARLCDSLVNKGYDEDNPLVLYEDTDGDLIVLDGRRRILACIDVEEYAVALVVDGQFFEEWLENEKGHKLSQRKINAFVQMVREEYEDAR